MSVPSRKKNLYLESHTVSKLSRGDLEDKYLRLLQEFEELKKVSLAQEDKCKHLFVQMNKLKALQSKLNSDSSGPGTKSVNPLLHKMVDSLQSKVTELELKNEKLEQKVQMSKAQSQSIVRRPPSRLDGKRGSLSGSKMDRSSSDASQFVAQHPPRYGHSLLEQARHDNQKLEDYALSLKTQINILENAILEQDKSHELACSRYEQQIEQLGQELAKSRGLYEVASNKENVDILRLQRELLDKSGELGALKSEHSSLILSLERAKEDHAQAMNELETANCRLSEEQKQSAQLLSQLRSLTEKNLNLLELEENVRALKSENRSLRETNDSLVKSTLDEERHRAHKAEVRELQNELEELRSELIGKSESLDRVQCEGTKRESVEEEFARLQELHEKLKTEHCELEQRLSSITGQGVTEWRELEEALVYMKERKEKLGETRELKKELLATRADHDDTILELDKTKKLLEVQHVISRAEREKTEKIEIRMEQMKIEYEEKIDGYVQVLDVRAEKIRKLETQLRDIAYGTKRYQMKMREGADSDEEGSLEREIELQRGQNLLEVHLQQLVIESDVLESLEGAEPHFFLSYDFFEFETEMTAVTKGPRPLFDSRSHFVVKVDDFFLEYIMKQTVPVEVYQVQGLEYRLVAKGHLDLKCILHDNVGGKIPCTAVATGVGDFQDTIQFGTLEYWVRIRLPLKEAFRLYQDRASALLAMGKSAPQQLSLASELVNELVIRVSSCKELLARREGTVPSPYVMYRFYEYPDHDTDIVSSSTEPGWNDEKKFPVTMDRALDAYLKKEPLQVYVFDDTDPDLKQYLGLANISLLPLVSSSDLGGSYPLLSPSGHAVGTINIHFNWTKSYLPGFSIGDVPADIPPPMDTLSDSDPERDFPVESALPLEETQQDSGSEFEGTILKETTTLPNVDGINLSQVQPPASSLDSNSMTTISENLLNGEDVYSKHSGNEYSEQFIPSPVASEQDDVLLDSLIAEIETESSLILPPEPVPSLPSRSTTPTPTEVDTINSEMDTILSSLKVSMTLETIPTIHPSPHFTIVIYSLTATSVLNQGPTKDHLVYVDYEFLNYDIEELETPNSIPIPHLGETAVFNFQKHFDFQAASDSEIKKKMLQGMLIEGSGSVYASSIKFTLVSEPQGAAEQQSCQELGCAFLDLAQVVNSEFNNLSADLPVFVISNPSSVVAHLNIQLLEVDCLREFIQIQTSE